MAIQPTAAAGLATSDDEILYLRGKEPRAFQNSNGTLAVDDGRGVPVPVHGAPYGDGHARDRDGLHRFVGACGDLDHVEVGRRIDRFLNIGVVTRSIETDGDRLSSDAAMPGLPSGKPRGTDYPDVIQFPPEP